MLYLEFETSIAELNQKIAELENISAEKKELSVSKEIEELKQRSHEAIETIYRDLTAVQKVQVARHLERPHFTNYVDLLMEEFVSLAGDRRYGEDKALLAGLAVFRGKSIVLIGHEKGNDLDTRIAHNFGMPRPEGYRKAIRIMELAERFRLPVVTLVDTAGAHPGIEAEERGQAEAIASCIEASMNLTVPSVAAIVGEGGSGGAVAIATANRIIMLEHSIYTVASPEASASILWKDVSYSADAAEALKLTAQDLERMGFIDSIVAEPLGGAHRNPELVASRLGDQIETYLSEMADMTPEDVRDGRNEKFIAMTRNLT